MITRRHWGWGIAWLAIVCVELGCEKPKVDPQVDHMKPLSILYSRFRAQFRGRPPKNEEEFKKFIDSTGSELLQQFNIADAATLLKSPRDGQPYVITYGKPNGSRIVAYESMGVDGKRWTADDLGKVEELDEATIRQMVPDFK